MSIELVHLCDITVTLAPPHILGQTASGTRMVFEVGAAEIKGERFSGTAKGGANADWLVIGPEGTGTLDVRVLAETHDGALVLIQYNGRVDMNLGLDGVIYAARGSTPATSAMPGSTRSRPSPRARSKGRP